MSNQVYVFSVVFRSTAEPEDSHIKDAVSSLEQAAALDDYIIQGERGASGNYHLQGYIKTTKKIRARTLEQRVELPSWATSVGLKPCSKLGRNALKRYVMKEDSRVLAPMGKRPIYLGRDLECMRRPFKWQQTVLDWIAGDPNDRVVRWICNPEGNAGKSKLLKWCRWKGIARRVGMGTATQLKTTIIEGGAHRAFLVDLPRVRGKQERIQELISALESVKNGDVMSSMYGKRLSLMMEPPHVIIVSNEMPDWRVCSMDRWKCYTLAGKHADLEPYEPEI